MYRHLLLSTTALLCAGCLLSGTPPIDEVPDNNSENNANNENNQNNGTVPPPNNPDNNPPNNNNRPVNNPPNNLNVVVNNVEPPVECPVEWLNGPFIELCQLAAADFGRTPLSNPPPAPDACDDPGCPSCDPVDERGMLCIPSAYEVVGSGFGVNLDLSAEYLITGGAGDPITVVEAGTGNIVVPPIPTQGSGARAAVAGDHVAVTNPSGRTVDLYTIGTAGAQLTQGDLRVDVEGFGTSIVGRRFGEVSGFLVGAPSQNAVYAILKVGQEPFNLFDGQPITASVDPSARFGEKIAVDAFGSTVAVLSPGTQSVFIFIFDDQAMAWLLSEEVAVSLSLGNLSDIALNADGTLLAVSDASNANVRVELFSAFGGWQSVQTFDGSQVGGGAGSGFGASVALAGNVVYVGAPLDDRVALYVGTPDIGYFPAGVIVSPDPTAGQFGANIAVSNSRVAIGGPRSAGDGYVWVGAIGGAFP